MDAFAELAKELVAQPAKIIISAVTADKWRTEKSVNKNFSKLDICITRINNIQEALNERFNKLLAVQKAHITQDDRDLCKTSLDDLKRHIDAYVEVAMKEQQEKAPDLRPIRKELKKRQKRLEKLLNFVRQCENNSVTLRLLRDIQGKLVATVNTTMGAPSDEVKEDALEKELSHLDKDIDELETSSA
jgi:gas vesicle protein